MSCTFTVKLTPRCTSFATIVNDTLFGCCWKNVMDFVLIHMICVRASLLNSH